MIAASLLVLAGLGVTSSVPAIRRRPVLVRLGWAYLFGAALVGVSLYALSHVASVPLSRGFIRGFVAALALAGAAASVLSGRSRRAPAARRSVVVLAAILVGGIVSLGLLAEAVTNPVTDWDGRQTWCVQARHLRAARTVDAPVLKSATTFVSNPRYPVLMPLLQVTALELAGAEDDDRLFRPLYAAFYPALLLVLFDGASRLAGRRAAAIATLAAAVVPDLTFWGNGGAGGTYSDVPLASFLGGGLLLLLLARRSVPAGLAAGLLLSAAVLTKTEGAPLALVALGVCGPRVVRALRQDRPIEARPWVAAAVLVLGAIALYVSWRSGIPARFDQGYAGFFRGAAFVRNLFPNLGQAIPVMLRTLVDLGHWGLLWPSAAALALAGRRGFSRPPAALLAAFAAPLALGCGAYSVHFDPPALAAATWSRFLIQSSLPLFVLMGIGVRSAFMWSVRK